MFRLKQFAVAIIATLVGAAIAASAASATFTLTAVECTSTAPTINTVCWATKEKGTPLFEFSGAEPITAVKEAGTTSTLVAKFGTEEVVIECKAAEALGGEILQPEPLVKTPIIDISTSLDFTECAVTGTLKNKCKVPTSLPTLPIVGTTDEEDGHIIFAPVTPPTFIEIEFTNGTETCPATVKGLKKVTGEQLCLILNTSEDLKLHTLECAKSGSKLKLGENVAEFELKLDVELVNSKEDFWSFDLA